MPTLIKCPCCEGSGKSQLAQHLEETLAVVPKRGSVVAEDVAEKLGLETPNVASNRLLDLFILKLVTRRRIGRSWHYTRI